MLKKGDRVRVKSYEWYLEMLRKSNSLLNTPGVDVDPKVVKCGFTKQMSEYCGKVVTLREQSSSIFYDKWRVEEDGYRWVWHEDMFMPAGFDVE